MNESNIIEISIEALIKNESWYVVSPFHCVYSIESSFDELENYLLETYINTFSDKISMIVSKLICLYSAYIELIEIFPEAPRVPFELPEYENIRDIGLKKIAQVIEYVIIQEGKIFSLSFSSRYN